MTYGYGCGRGYGSDCDQVFDHECGCGHGYDCRHDLSPRYTSGFVFAMDISLVIACVGNGPDFVNEHILVISILW